MSADPLTMVLPGAAWLPCAFALTVRFVLTGAAWSWLLPEEPFRHGGRIAKALLHAAASLLLGVPLSLLSSLVLAETGRLSAGMEWAVALCGILAGLTAGGLRAPDRLKFSLSWSLPGAAFVFLGLAVILNLPRCGEWIVGGWDPGIYINQGVAVARTGTFHPSPEPHHAALTEPELLLFTQGSKGNAPQLFPAVPIDTGSRTVLHYFFRLTPALVSTLALHGGLCAATRMPAIAGFLVLLLFPAVLRLHGCRPSCIGIAALLLALHPLWLYHLHFPTSEMTELFLFLGLAGLLPLQRTGWYCRVLFLLLLLAALLNRFSFLPIALMITLAAAWADGERTDRIQVLLERLLQFLVIVLGTVYDYTVTAVTIHGLQYAMPHMVNSALVFLAGTAFLDWAPLFKRSQPFLRPSPVFGIATAGLALTALGSFWLWRQIPLFEQIRRNALHIGPFLGVPWLLPALPGILILWFRRGQHLRHLSALILVCTVVTVLLQVKTFTFPFYPWTTRRFLPFSVPMLAVTAAIALSELWHWRALAGWLRRLCVIALLGALLAGTARLSWHALAGSEYDGLSARLAEVAKQVGPRDLVVTDHFRWGTPLAFLHGVHVLDGSAFQDARGAGDMPEALMALTRLRAEGWRILWLTSTPAGLGIYPRPLAHAVRLGDAGSFTVREIIHGPRVRDFATRERPILFQLYQWP